MTAVDLLVQLAAKGSVVFVMAWLTTRLMARCSAAARHVVWAVALAATLVLPVAAMAGLSWSLPVLPAAVTSEARDEDSRTLAEATRVPTEGPVESVFVMGALAVPPPSATPMSPGPGRGEARRTRVWPLLVAAVWAAGVLVALARLWLGFASARRIVRGATTVERGDWLTILDSSREALGVTRPVGLTLSGGLGVPLVSGLRAPVIVLPRDADAWSAERLRVVLLHELAHVRRRDCLVQLLSRIAAAPHWFNPLAHVALVRLHAEQEQACDDLVIAAGTERAEYAMHLFEIVRAFRTSSLATLPGSGWAALAMARSSHIERRLRAILDASRSPRLPSRRAVTTAMVAAVVAVLLLGGARLVAVDRAEKRSHASAASGPRTLVRQPRTLVQEAGDTEPPAGSRQDEGTSAPAPAQPAIPNSPAATARPFVTVHDGDWQAGVHAFADIENSWTNHLADYVHVAPEGLWFTAAHQGAAPGAQDVSPEQQAAQDEARRRAADALSSALIDDNEGVRQAAAQALANMRDERALPALIAAMKSSDARVRQMMVTSLGRFDTPEVRGALRAALKDGDASVRRQAVLALGRYRDGGEIDAIAGLLQDTDVDVRTRVVEALGAVNDPRAIDALTRALKDSEARVRQRAVSALGRIARGQPAPSIWTKAGPFVDEIVKALPETDTFVWTEGFKNGAVGLEARQKAAEQMKTQIAALREKLQGDSGLSAYKTELQRAIEEMERALQKLR